jgi:hypothetical protein
MPDTALVVVAGGLAVFLCSFNYLSDGEIRYLSVAWPWNVPIGFVVAFALGYLLGRRPARTIPGEPCHCS